MASTLVESTIMFYELVQVFVAFLAIVFALKWRKYEFLPGLFFLGLYAIVEAIDVYLTTVVHAVFIDYAQFGFILLATVFFIIGMHPSWSARMVGGTGEQDPKPGSSRPRSLISTLRRL